MTLALAQEAPEQQNAVKSSVTERTTTHLLCVHGLSWAMPLLATFRESLRCYTDAQSFSIELVLYTTADFM